MYILCACAFFLRVNVMFRVIGRFLLYSILMNKIIYNLWYGSHLS